MSRRIRTTPLIAVVALLVTMAFLGVFALFIYALMDEEYRRHAANLMPAGHQVLWQNYVGYPVNWIALKQVVLQMWLMILPFVVVSAFASRLLILSFFAIKSPLPSRKNWWRFIYIASGVALAVLTAYASLGVRNEWFGNMPVRQMAYCASATFLLVPLWLAFSSPTTAYKTDAGNGSKAICRDSNVSRSPSPDPSR